MQPIIFLAVVAVAAGAISVGFLGNTFDLSMVQLIGVGETDLETPVDKVNVDFMLGRATGFSPEVNTVITRNVIAYCIIQNFDPASGSMGMAIPFETGSRVICKLTDEFMNVVAEGFIITEAGDKKVTVHISQISFPLANDVTNIHDLQVVIQGPEMVNMD